MEVYATSEQHKNLIISLFVYLGSTSGISFVELIYLIEKLPNKMSELTKNAFQEAEEIGEKRGKERGKLIKENQFITRINELGLELK